MDAPRSAATQPVDSNQLLARDEQTQFHFEPTFKALLDRVLPYDRTHRAMITWLLQYFELASMSSILALLRHHGGDEKKVIDEFLSELVKEKSIKPHLMNVYSAEIGQVISAVREAHDGATSAQRMTSRKRSASPSLSAREVSPSRHLNGRFFPPKHLENLNTAHPRFWALFAACVLRTTEVDPAQTSKCPCGSVQARYISSSLCFLEAASLMSAQASTQYYNYVTHLKSTCKFSSAATPVYLTSPEGERPPPPPPLSSNDVADIAALPLSALLKVPSRFWAYWTPEQLAQLPADVSAGIGLSPSSPHPSDSPAVAASAPVRQLSLHAAEASGVPENFLLAPEPENTG